ncbi:hypothetical protein BH11BAC3_BH11BAC3_32000 [soil metagenome]
MRTISIKIFSVLICCIALWSCKKDIPQVIKSDGTAPMITLSPASVTLTSATAGDTVQNINWTRADFAFKAAVTYTVEIADNATDFSKAKTFVTGSATSIKYLGAVLNDLAIGAGIQPGNSGSLYVRVKAALSDAVSIYSGISTLAVTTYAVQFPALLVKGGNSWVTPASRSNGYVLTSVNFNNKYEGYLNLPNADNYGGDAFQLIGGSSGTVYGWGGTNTTLSVNGGNLWLTPAPNYMKVNVDLDALTINFTPVNFFVTGDHNSWNTASTPMTFDAATNSWVANNVTFTAGNKFVFTSNGSYDNSYKVDASGKLMYAGPPSWAGNNIDAPGTGTYKVTLDLSAGDGSYIYKVE